MRTQRGTILYGLFIALVVTAALGAAAVLFEAIGGGQHLAGSAASSGLLAVAVDSAGVLLVLPLLSQLVTGFRLTALPYARFRRVHAVAAWTGAVLVSLHGTGAVVHTLETPETLPVVLIVLGVLMVVLMGTQAGSGLAVSRFKRRQMRPWHMGVGAVLLAAVLVHNALGVWHAVTG